MCCLCHVLGIQKIQSCKMVLRHTSRRLCLRHAQRRHIRVRLSPFCAFVSNEPGYSIWKSALLVPLYFVALSLLAISVECIALSKPAQILSSKLSPPRSPLFTNTDHEESENEGVASDFKAHVRSFGDTTIFFYRFARFLGCISLVGLTIFTAVIGDSGTDLDAWKKGGSKKSKKYGWPFSKQETLNLAVCLSYVCIREH